MKAWSIALASVLLAGAVGSAGLFARTYAARVSSGETQALGLRDPKARGESLRHGRSAAPASPALALADTKLDDAPHPTEQQKPLAAFRQTSTYSGGIVYVRRSCRDSYDVLLHFHGAHTIVRDLADSAGLDAVISVYNEGVGSDAYAKSFGTDHMLTSLLRQLQRAVLPLCPGAHPRRIALSAWSAGYAAVEKLITRDEDRARVDTVLLADGLHAAFVNPRQRELGPDALASFRRFAVRAVAGEALFAITHSSIATPGYASTTECSRFLLERLQLPLSAPLVSGGSGAFSVVGASGEDKAAHVAQFRRMDRALFDRLRERWQPP